MTGRIWRWRLRLAQYVAPNGADVHNPDDTACPWDRPILEAAEAYDLYRDDDGKVRLDVTEHVDDAEAAGWMERAVDPQGNAACRLTGFGERSLARLRRSR